MVSFWRVRDSRNAVIPNHILKRSVWHAPSVVRTLLSVRRKKAENTMDVRTILIVILWYGRDRQMKNVNGVAVSC